MALPFSFSGSFKNLSASGQITSTTGTQPVGILGFYVNSTNAGTLVINKGGSGGTALTGTITPAIGWHFYPIIGDPNLYAVIGGTALDVTFVLNSAA